MATRKVILTERELTSLIRRIIQETEEMDSSKSKKRRTKKATKTDVVDTLGDFFSKHKSKLRGDEEKIMMAAKKFASKEVSERYLQEGDEDEDDNNIEDRKSSFRDKLMTRGGFTMAALGLVGVIGRSMGWSEFETTTKIFQFMEELGTGQYSGPITVAMIVAGLGMAIRGIANKYNRENR